MVWVPDRNSEATVRGETNARSYEVETEDGVYRRNRRDLVELAQDTAQAENADDENRLTTEVTIRSSKRTSQPPDRLNPSWN